MTFRWMLALTTAASLAVAATAVAQVRRPGIPTCPADTPAQLESRRLALDAVRQINLAARRFKMQHQMYPSWQELADTPPVRLYGGLSLKWGTDEPVPDWKIHYLTDQGSYLFTLTGARDKCGISFVSDETARVLDGRDMGASYGVVPLGTH